MARVRIVASSNPILGPAIAFHALSWDSRDPTGIGPPTHIGAPLRMDPIDAGEMAPPTFTLRPDDAQSLMDELWRIGLRPAEAFNGEAFKAQGAHLADMRRLVFEGREAR